MMYIMYMALHINNPETERNVRAMADATGESIAEAVNQAVLYRMKSMTKRRPDPKRMEKIRELLARLDALPVLDARSADEIIGYDENGLPI
jgi:antitoxin VapB